MRSIASITGYTLASCILLAAGLSACAFNARPASGKVQCGQSADCPGEVPVCWRGACYAVGAGGDDGSSGSDVADTDGGSPEAATDQQAATDRPAGNDGGGDSDSDSDGDSDGGGDSAADAPGWLVCQPPAVTNLGNGLIAYLRLDEGPADPMLVDSSPAPQTVVLRDIDPQGAWTTGRFGRALTLPGGAMGGYVAVGPSPKLSTVVGALTLSAWIRFPTGSAPDGVVISRRAAGAGGYHYRLGIAGNHLQARLQTSNGLNANLISNQPLPSTTLWVHLAMTYATGITDGLRLYVDGKPFGTQTFQLPFGSETTPLLVGAAEAPNFDLPAKTIGERLAAQVDEVAVFARALSSDEIRALACGQRPGQ